LYMSDGREPERGGTARGAKGEKFRTDAGSGDGGEADTWFHDHDLTGTGGGGEGEILLWRNRDPRKVAAGVDDAADGARGGQSIERPDGGAFGYVSDEGSADLRESRRAQKRGENDRAHHCGGAPTVGV